MDFFAQSQKSAHGSQEGFQPRENPTRIVGYSSSVYYKLPYEDGTRPYRYVVTSVNRYNAESKAKSKKVKL